MRLRWWTLAALALAGCSGSTPGTDPPDTGDGLRHEPLALRCTGRLPASDVAPLGRADEDTFFVQLYGSGFQNGANTTVGFVTHDGGRTGAIVPNVTEDDGLTRYLRLGAAQNVVAVDASFWASYAERSLSTIDSNFNPLSLTMIADGAGHEVAVDTVSLALPDGSQTLRVWKADALRWMALSVPWLWATTNGGAAWTRLGPVPFWNSVLSSGTRVFLRAQGANGDQVVFKDISDPAQAGGFTVQTGAGAPTAVPVDSLGRQQVTNLMRWWGDALVYLNGSKVWRTTDRGATWTELETVEHPISGSSGAQLDATVDSAGNLIVVPITPPDDQPRHVYRYGPGATVPTVLDPEADAPPLANLTRPVALSGGVMRTVALVAPSEDRPGQRETYSGLICEFGPGVTGSWERKVVEPLAAAASGGRVVRVAGFKDLNDQDHRFAVSPSGRMFGRVWQGIVGLPLDVPELYQPTATVGAPNYGNVPEGGNILPQALDTATDWVVGAYFHNPESGEPTLKVAFDARTTALTFASPLADELDVSTVDTWGGDSMEHTSLGTFLRGLNGSDAPRFDNTWLVNGPYGVALTTLQRELFQAEAESGFVRRFTTWKGRGPDGSCPAAPGCLPTPPMAPVAAQMDMDGNLYVVDGRKGEVLLLPTGKEALTDWVVLARGFLTPTDLKLRREQGKQLVMVYDGDVFAFAVDPSRTLVRGADDPPAPPDKAIFAARDLHDCLDDGPCLDDTSDTPVAAGDGSAVCVSGRGFGAANGRLFAGATEGQVTSWSDTNACASFSGLTDGRLKLVRADGAGSNLIPYVADGAVTGWDVPDPLYPESLVTVHGRNLGHPGGKDLTFEDDVWQRWPAGANDEPWELYKDDTLLDSRALHVTPRVDLSCTSTQAQACTIFGAGFGTGPPTADELVTMGYTATVGGLPAALQSWRALSISLAWPAGLAPGSYPFVLHHPGGPDVAGTAALIAHAPQLLVRGAPFPAAYSYAQQRPQFLSSGLYAPMIAWSGEAVRASDSPGSPAAVGMQPERLLPTFEPGEPPYAHGEGFGTWFVAGMPVHVLETHGVRVLAGTAQSERSDWTLGRLVMRSTSVLADGGLDDSDLARNDVNLGQQPVAVEALGMIGSTPVLAMAGQFTATTVVAPIVITDDAIGTGTQVTVGGVFGWEGGHLQPVAQGAWLTGEGIYLSSCHRPGGGGEVHFVPLAEGANGDLEVGVHDEVETGAGDIIACNTTPSPGFIWVQREPDGEAIYVHTPGAGMIRLVGLPATLPGVGVDWTYSSDVSLPGVTDVALLPDGDVLVLTNTHDGDERGLRLARWSTATDTWTLGVERVAPGTRWQLGELCVGPVPMLSALCPTGPLYGCAPYACPLRPAEIRERATAHIGEAYIVPRGSDVSLVYEAVETQRIHSVPYGGTEVHHIRVPMP